MRMRVVYLLLVLQLHWVAAKNSTSTSTAQDRSEESEQVAKALDVGSQVIEAIAEVITDKGLKKFQSVAVKFATSLGLAGALFSAFLPDETAIALEEIQDKLEKIDERLDDLSNQIDSVAQQILFEHALTRANGDVVRLINAGKVLNAYVHDPSEHNQDIIKGYFTDKSLIYTAINGLYTNINGEAWVGKSDLFEEIYEKTRGNWLTIHAMYMHLQPIIVKSIATYIVGCQLVNEDCKILKTPAGCTIKECENAGTSLMGVNKEHQDLMDTNLNNALEKCRSEYWNNRLEDVRELLRDNRDKGDNQAMADILAKFLREKYFWRDTTVVVLKGGLSTEFHSGSPGNLYFQNTGGRAVRILDGNTVPDTFSPSTTIPTKAKRCDIVQICHKNDYTSMYGSKGWYRDISVGGDSGLRSKFWRTLTDKGFRQKQVLVVMKEKFNCGYGKPSSAIDMGYNLGKNGKMIVGGRDDGRGCRGSSPLQPKKVFFHLFVQLQNQQFACEGDANCCCEGMEK